MYHIVPDIGFSDYIVVHWDCHDDVRLVSSKGYMLFHGREVGFTDGLGWIYGIVLCY